LLDPHAHCLFSSFQFISIIAGENEFQKNSVFFKMRTPVQIMKVFLSLSSLFLFLLFVQFHCTVSEEMSSSTCENPAVGTTTSLSLSAENKIGQFVPSGSVDLVVPSVDGYSFVDNQDFGEILRKHKKAVVFAVPGAFTPTCSGKHLPGFIEQANEMRSRGVEAIYCLSVNDKYVMKAWGESTLNCLSQSVILVADGNAAFTKAFGAENDRASGRMGLRSQRYGFIVEEGKVTHLFHDTSGLNKSSAENLLLHL
jgi:peroxiredoxin